MKAISCFSYLHSLISNQRTHIITIAEVTDLQESRRCVSYDYDLLMSRAGLVILDYAGVVTRIIFIQGLQTGSFCNEDQERKPITTKLLEQVLSSFAEGVTAAQQAKLLICSDAPVQQGSLSNVHAAKALAKRKRLQAKLDLYNKVSGFYSTFIGQNFVIGQLLSACCRKRPAKLYLRF